MGARLFRVRLLGSSEIVIIKTVVADEPVRLISLPAFTRKAVAAWDRFVASDDVFGMDVESTAIEGLGSYDPSIKMRLIQFGNKYEAWALDPSDPRWRKRITSLLGNEAKRFVSHNASFDTVRVLFEFDINLGERSLDTLPMAALLWPGHTHVGGKGLKALSDDVIDHGLSDAETELHGLFVDRFTAQKDRKTPLLPKNFTPGVSTCRKPKSKGGPKCANLAWSGSLCGYCREHYLARKITQEMQVWGWSNIPLNDPTFLKYAGLDAVYVRRLLDILAARLVERGMGRLSKTEQRVKRHMTMTSVHGMLVDKDWTAPILDEVEVEFCDAEARVLDATHGIKARSPKLADWFGDQGLRVKSLDKDHLPALIEKYGLDSLSGHDPVIGDVLNDLLIVSKNANLLSNLRTIWKHATQGDGYVHPNINTMQAHTGRMSATNPAVQTLAKAGEKGTRLRGCFIARPGCVLVGADYDSQEIRIGAALSRDPAMLRIVREGLNQHVLTAESIFPDFTNKAECPLMYHRAKTLDFAQQYGAMPRKIGATLGISPTEALALWQKWRHTYAGLVKWSAETAAQRTVVNSFGRSIPRDPLRDYANANYMIQSTGRDVLGAALCRLADAHWDGFFWLPMHDEMILEVPERFAQEAADALTRYMSTQIKDIPLPAKGEIIGTRWGAAPESVGAGGAWDGAVG